MKHARARLCVRLPVPSRGLPVLSAVMVVWQTAWGLTTATVPRPDARVDTTYVSLDLELLDSAAHGYEILEIGAIRFRGDREIETFSVLVRTTSPLTYRAARLTRLTE